MGERRFEIKQRGKERRKTKPVYLVVAEGKNKTETLYLSHFQQQGMPYSLHFVKAGNKTDAESLYGVMVAKWKELELASDTGAMGFTVLDLDADSQQAAKVMKLIHDNDNESIKFIVSNPTFEIWILIHFKYTTKHFSSGSAVINELRKYIPDYEKSKDCYLECLNKQQEAVKNGEKLEKHFEGNQWPSVECNPRTDMAELIRVLCFNLL